jgi:hypothetical protein
MFRIRAHVPTCHALEAQQAQHVEVERAVAREQHQRGAGRHDAVHAVPALLQERADARRQQLQAELDDEDRRERSLRGLLGRVSRCVV